MHVYVRLAEPFWRAVGRRDLDLELAPDSRVSDLLALLRRRHPELARELDEAPPTIFIGDREAHEHTVLCEGSRVHLVWPVAGG